MQLGDDILGGRDHWVVRVTLATMFPPNERQLEAMADAADAHDMTVAARGPIVDDARDDAGMVFTAEVPADEIGQVPGRALAIAQETCGYGIAMQVTLVDLRICTADVYEAEALRPDTPELLAATDVAELLGISRQRVHQLHSERADFPAPYARLGSGPIWTRPAIEAFDKRWTRKPGRPARAAS